MPESGRATTVRSGLQADPQTLASVEGARLEAALGHLSPKRKAHGPGLDGWYPYYSGFSYKFVRTILPELIKKRRAVVLDPWNGSGTTTAAAWHLGHISLGFDLNPAAVTIANAKFVSADELESLIGLLESCLEAARKSIRARSRIEPGALQRWLPPTAARFAHASIDWLCAHDAVSATHELLPGTALATLCVLHGIRDYAVDRNRSNASWVSPNPSLARLRIDTLTSAIFEHAQRIIRNGGSCPKSHGPLHRVRVGDARQLPVPAATVDVALSSPPYCTRVDYARQTGFELAALEGLTDATSRELRHNLMGTTTIRSIESQSAPLPRGVSDLLHAICTHHSHRSEAYYGRNFRQYFEDAALAVGELARILRPGGKAVLVLQNSF